MAIDVHLWWIGADAADERLLDTVCGWTERVFRVHARTYRHAERPTHAFDPRRGQHSSTAILKWLVGRAQAARRTLAITDADLFIPVLTFVYGEAQLGGRAAVVSTARLASDNGFRPDRPLMRERTLKETVHEIGHTFGLIHCGEPTCVMSRSVNLAQVDAKDPALCADCRRRYAELRERGHHEHE